MMMTHKKSKPAAGWRVICFALTGLMLFGACGAARGADTAKLIASPEPDWPQWRGPKRDAVSTETGLLDAWPEGGPKLLWKTTGLGRGWCSPIIVKDTIYICGEIKWDLVIISTTQFRTFAADADTGKSRAEAYRQCLQHNTRALRKHRAHHQH